MKLKVKKLLANASLFTVQHLQSNLNEFTGHSIYLQNNGLILQKPLLSLKEQINIKKGKQLISN
jgi:hypothetical protein